MSGDQTDQYKNYYNQNGGGAGSNFKFKIIKNIDPFGGGFGGFGGQGGQGQDNFKDFWADIDDFFGGGATQKEKSKKGKDIIVNTEINFMDAIHGCQKILNFDRVCLCNTCSGSKCRPGTSPTQCGTCGGSGRVYYKQGFMSIAMACNACNGEGTSIRSPCTSCFGKGVTSQRVKETINIPKGVDENMNLRLQRKVKYNLFTFFLISIFI